MSPKELWEGQDPAAGQEEGGDDCHQRSRASASGGLDHSCDWARIPGMQWPLTREGTQVLLGFSLALGVSTAGLAVSLQMTE